MKNIQEFNNKVDLPPLTQIGVVVRDMKQALEFYSRTFGLGPFSPISELVADKNWYMGTLCPLHLRISRALWGGVEFELIQPLEGKSVHQDFLDTYGEGINHLGVETDNYDEVVGRMNQSGFRSLQVIETFRPEYNCWGKATFFDTRSIGGFVIEVMCRPWLASWLGRR